MPDQWMVRVEGREYGPVDTEALREWTAEGRLIPQNEVRQVGEERWFPARELPEIFAAAEDAAASPASDPPDIVVRRRNWPEIFRETLRVYQGGFARFVFFGLLTAVPMFVLQWYFPRVALPDFSSGLGSIPPVAVPPICFIMLLLTVLLFPIATAGFQFVADDVLRGRHRSLREQFSAAMGIYGRMLSAGLLVYGSYFFWTVIPFTTMIAVLASGLSVLSIFLYLAIGAFMMYMIGRLFINFLFWEQTATFGDGGGNALLALRASKELARSIPQAPRPERPLYRGATLATLWLVLLLFILIAVQAPFTMIRLSGAASPEQALAVVQSLAEAKTPDALMIASDVVSAVVNLLFRPLLAAAFLILYYDAKARRGG
jgi:hypothetical protein